MKRSKETAGVLAITALAFVSNPVSAASLKTIYSFCSLANCQDGTYAGTLATNAAGHLYGTATYGGSAPGFNGHGTVFELIPKHRDEWSLGRLYVFCSDGGACTDGASPFSNVVIDNSGNLYGTTIQGGTGGTVFELVSLDNGAAWNLETLHNFAGSDGKNPSSTLTYVGAADGNYYDGHSPLYGSTENGGIVDDGGTVYQLAPSGDSWTLTTLHDFSNDGAEVWPFYLSVSSSGIIYGETGRGGERGDGSIYSLSQTVGNWSETILYEFDREAGDDTYYPFGAPTLTNTGSLYGSTEYGGPRCKYKKHHGYLRCGGSVFKLDTAAGGGSYSPIYAFCQGKKTCADGESPVGPLVRAKSGALYGSTLDGGANGKGVIFEIKKSGLYTVLYNFCSETNCRDGANPQGGLLRGPYGKLYGTTTSGGANNAGTVFEFTP